MHRFLALALTAVLLSGPIANVAEAKRAPRSQGEQRSTFGSDAHNHFHDLR